MTLFKSPFAFFGQNHKLKKIQTLMHIEDTELCACDKEGVPQAFFTLPIITKVPCIHIFEPSNQKVLGVPRVEGLELLGYKPTLLLEHKSR